MKNLLKIICILSLSALLISGCGSNNKKTEVGTSNSSGTPTVTESAADSGNAASENATGDEAAGDTVDAAVTEPATADAAADNADSGNSADSTDNNQTVASDSLDSTSEVADPNYDPDFKQVYEAEEAAFTGSVKIESTKPGFTGTGYLTGIQADSDTVTFSISVPGTGMYDLNFVSAGNTGHKENNVLLDGVNIGLTVVDLNDFTDAVMERVYMTAGTHEIKITKSWGWILLDSLIITASAPADKTIYDVSAAELVDPDATDRAKRLYQYLKDMYGKYIISGQYGDMGIMGKEFAAIKNATGKYPAILGLDFIEYTPSRVANGSVGMDVQYAEKFDQEGGIVTFCWHWNAPEKYLINTDDNPWWRGFYTDASTIDLKKIMNGEDQEGYDLLIRDIDAIAVQLKALQDADIPILWRPLHEASGGWFWWGASGPEAYIKLYQLLYDRLVNYHGIHNLIWVWNGQNKDWYPGDAYVDIVGMDIYPGERVYNSQSAVFDKIVDWNGSNKKIIAMSENGCMFDPELAVRDNAMWSYFAVWEGEFLILNNTLTLSQKYTETDMLKKVYTSDTVITLDELPDLKTYGN